MKEILDVIHKTICQFFDEYNGETPISDKDKLLLEVNKAITNNLKALEKEPFTNNACVYIRVCEHNKSKILDKIRAKIKMYEADCRLQGGTDECEKCNSNVFGSIYQIIDKYKAESEHKRTLDADELLKRIAEKCKTPSLSEDTVNGLCGATAIIYDMLIESGQEKDADKESD